MVNVVPEDRKDDITYLEEMLQEVAKCLADKVYADWKRTNKLISRDIAASSLSHLPKHLGTFGIAWDVQFFLEGTILKLIYIRLSRSLFKFFTFFLFFLLKS